MPVNEFEKQVQQKMDELQLRPSGEVWEEVEKRIRQEKKRRRVIFWFFIFGAMLAGGSVWWLTTDHKQPLAGHDLLPQTTIEKTTTNTNTATEKDNTPEQQNNIVPGNITEEKNTPGAGTTTIPTTPSDDLPVVDIKISPGTKKTVTAPSTVEKTIPVSPPETVKNNTKPVSDKPDLSVRVFDASKATQRKPATDTPIATIAKNSEDQQPVSKDIAVTDPPVARTAPEEAIVTDKKVAVPATDSVQLKASVAAVHKNREKKKNKWEFGATVFAGSSKVTNNISIGNLLGGEKRLDANPQSAPQQSLGPVIPRSPAAPGAGFAWQAGVYAKKKISPRRGISLGLDFSAFSTTQRTGVLLYNDALIRNDFSLTAVSNYYSNGTVGTHTNRYYYLQLPVYFHWQVNKGDKLPVVWKNGFSFGALAGSDAVIYSAASNVYYRDNKLIKKTQLSYQSGVYLKMFNRTAHPVTVGGLVNYHFSKLEKIETNKKNHLTSFGLQVGWIFKK